MKYLPLFALLLLFSCTDNDGFNYSGDEGEAFYEEAPRKDMSAPDAPVPERKVIRNGYMRIESENLAETTGKIKESLKALDGHITNESANDHGRRVQQTLTLRVPEKNFEALVEAMAAISKKVEEKNIFTQDVTRQYVDLEARLNNQKALEERYLELLKQANNMENIIAIEKQLSEVRMQIETIETQLRHMKNQVQYSTLEVSIYRDVSRASSFFSKAGESFGEGWEVFISFLLAMFLLWPFWILIAVILILLRWRKRRKLRKQKTSN